MHLRSVWFDACSAESSGGCGDRFRHRAGLARHRSRLRVVYVGGVERVTLYFNTRNITCANVAVRGYAATLPTADQRPDGNVCFYYDGSHGGIADTALAAAAALITFADSPGM